MLVVIGLIVFLMAAVLIVIPRVANASKVASTRATIKTVNEQLNDRINGFRRWINKQNLTGGVPNYVVNSPFAGLWSQNAAAARILAVKYWFKTSFPQQLEEINANWHPNDANTGSAACLYIILTQQAVFDTEPPAGLDLKAFQAVDTDNDGRLEIVDAWGHPLRFYRWPTRLTRPGASYASSLTATGFVEAPAPTPLSLTMIGGAPRMPLPVWKPTTPYAIGAMIVPNSPPNSGAPYSAMYQCISAGTSGAGEPAWPTVSISVNGTPQPFAAIGQTIADGTNGLVWQSVLDPLSVDADDPLGLVYLTNGTLIGESGSPQIVATPNTWSNPLILSTASDQDPPVGQPPVPNASSPNGLFEPWDTTDLGNLGEPRHGQIGLLYSNITNHQQQR